jgi:hypothetical protein
MQNCLSTVQIEDRKVFEIIDFQKSEEMIAAPIHVAIAAAKMGVEPKTEPHPAHPEAKVVSYPVWHYGWRGNATVTHMTAPRLIEYMRSGRGKQSPANHTTVVAATV